MVLSCCKREPISHGSKSLSDSDCNLTVPKLRKSNMSFCSDVSISISTYTAATQFDHKLLKSIMKKLLAAAPKWLQMILQLQKYEFTIFQGPGKDTPVADTLRKSLFDQDGSFRYTQCTAIYPSVTQSCERSEQRLRD